MVRFILIVILESWSERGRVKIYFRFRVTRGDNCLLKGEFFSFGLPFSPIVAVVSQRDYCSVGFEILHSLDEIVFVPVLRSHCSRIASRVVLVVGHQHCVVVGGSVTLVIPVWIVEGYCLHNKQALGREDRM